MATLTDGLVYVLGAHSADRLDEGFGIRTVDDLLRHYPRSYTVGATVRGAEDEKPETGQHITIVDTITSAAMIPTRKDPRKKIFRITEGIVVEGRIQKPNAFYVLQRSSMDYDWESLKQDFLPKILDATGKHPF